MTGHSVTVGVDLGGTGTRIAVLGPDGALSADCTLLTAGLGADGGPGQAVRDLAGRIRVVTGPDARVSSAGIGASGPVGTDGVIRNDETLPGFSHVPVCDLLAELLGARCVIDSDAVTAAIGEYARGAGRGAEVLLVVTLGTGVGVCVLENGRPYRGGDGLHPEAGHIPVPGPPAPCYCGLPVCWEQKASRTALQKSCQAFLGTPSAALGQARESAALVAGRARNGDHAAQDLFGRYGGEIGQGVAALAAAFRPARVVLGGSAASYFDLFVGGTRDALARRSPYELVTDLRPAELGDVGGAIGAAEMARRPGPDTGAYRCG